jgi:dTDP-4-amino-4,6-dideoxygalactose transaminase
MSDNKRIYLSSPHMSGGEMRFIKEAFDKNWIAPLGPNVDAFEESLAGYCAVKNAAALSSGTAAIHLALIILGVKPGDEVIASSFTFSATVNPIVYVGATPILVGSEPGTWNMDPDLLEKAIKDKRQKTKDKSIKAIIVVHLYGMPARMEEIMAIANKYEIPVIEDAAEALGSCYQLKPTGSFGKMAVLSFNGNKIITTSGGGALISDDKGMIEKARFLATQARDPAPHYQHSEIGFNYRMSNILAGIGRGQMEVIDERVKLRRAVNRWYRDLFLDVPGIAFQSEPSDEFFSNYWLTCITIDPDKTGTDREKFRLSLEVENIESRPLWKPMHLQPVFSGAPAFVNGTSERLFSEGLCLPSASNLTDSDLSRIAKVTKKEFHI